MSEGIESAGLAKAKAKARGLLKSKTHWASAALAIMIAIHPYLLEWAKVRMEPADYALAGAVVYGVLAWLRWVTDTPLEDK